MASVKPKKVKPVGLLRSEWKVADITAASGGKRPMDFVASELTAIIETMPPELDAIIDNAKLIRVFIETE